MAIRQDGATTGSGLSGSHVPASANRPARGVPEMQRMPSLAAVVAACLMASACATPQRRMADERVMTPQTDQTMSDKASEPFWK